MIEFSLSFSSVFEGVGVGVGESIGVGKGVDNGVSLGLGLAVGMSECECGYKKRLTHPRAHPQVLGEEEGICLFQSFTLKFRRSSKDNLKVILIQKKTVIALIKRATTKQI